MLKKVLITTLCLSVLTACGGSDSSDSSPPKELSLEEKILQLEDKGQLAKLDRSDSILGTDQNNNGIRDDIDAYIQKTYTNEEAKAVNQLAKVLQDSLTVDLEDGIKLQDTGNEYMRSVSCIHEKFEDGVDANGVSVTNEILAMTTNTKQRLTAYISFSDVVDGYVFKAPEEGYCNV